MRNYFILLMTGSVILTGCKSKPEKEEATSVSAATEVITVQKGKLSTNFQTPGELIAFQQVDVYAKENSFVKQLLVDVGSEVQEGQLLAVLEAPELSSQVIAAESRLQAQAASYIASKSNYDRMLQTSKTAGAISPNDLDQALAKRNADSAQLAAAKAAYHEIQQLKDYLEIKAPFAGVISSRNVNVGAYVGPSGKGSELPLFTLQQQKKLRLVISVPETYTGYLNSGTEINFNVRSLPGKKFTAKISRIAGALDSRLRSERVEMDVINNDKVLLPGMVADVNVVFPARDSNLIAPKTAVISSTEKVFVIRVRNNKAEWVDVQRGLESNNRIEIFGNLSAGDTLIKIGSDEIRNGSDIKQIKLTEGK